MNASRDLHRFARFVGDAEAAARGPAALLLRILRRGLYRAWFRILNRALR